MESRRIRVGNGVTVYPRGKKKIYVADFFQDGKHRRVSLKTSNLKVAKQKAALLEAEMVTGVHRLAPPPVEFAAVIDQYLGVLATNGRSPRTLVKYRGQLHGFRRFLAVRRVTKLHAVEAVDFDAWREARGKVVKPVTAFDEAVLAKQLFKFAKSRKLIAENPLADIMLQEPPTFPKPAPSLDQLNAILTAADEELRGWLMVLALTGMRVGELQRLRREDVDFAGGWIHICSRPGAETKNKSSRKVPMHVRLQRALESLPPGKHLWFFTATPGSRYPEGGHWIGTAGVNLRLGGVLERLGLPAGRESGFVVHSLRHFFETYTINANVPQRVVDTWLGHRSDRSMASVYYRLLDHDSQAFMGKVPFDEVARESPSPVAPSSGT